MGRTPWSAADAPVGPALDKAHFRYVLFFLNQANRIRAGKSRVMIHQIWTLSVFFINALDFWLARLLFLNWAGRPRPRSITAKFGINAAVFTIQVEGFPATRRRDLRFTNCQS